MHSAPSQSSGSEETIERVDVRPGLTMVKRRTRKEDGRALIYYHFERPDAPSSATSEDS